MKILATASLAALIVSAALTAPTSAKTVLPMADRDACLGMSAPRPKVSPAQRAELRARSQRANDSGNGLAMMAQKRYSILLQRFYIEQCTLRRQGQAYDRRCPMEIIPMQAAIDTIPADAFAVDKREFRALMTTVSEELDRLRGEMRSACAQ